MIDTIKRGDTFGGVVELFRNGTSEPALHESDYDVEGTISGVNVPFSGSIIFNRTAPGRFEFACNTNYWPLGRLKWDIKFKLNGRQVSAPSINNMVIDVVAGV